MLRIMNDPTIEPARRDAMAKAAAPPASAAAGGCAQAHERRRHADRTDHQSDDHASKQQLAKCCETRAGEMAKSTKDRTKDRHRIGISGHAREGRRLLSCSFHFIMGNDLERVEDCSHLHMRPQMTCGGLWGKLQICVSQSKKLI